MIIGTSAYACTVSTPPHDDNLIVTPYGVMYTPRGTHSRAGGGFQPASKVPLKGLLTDGSWHCNCEPRLPAVHLQTKNGGKNHGRWCMYSPQDQPTGRPSC
jgi:hypothetical protein